MCQSLLQLLRNKRWNKKRNHLGPTGRSSPTRRASVTQAPRELAPADSLPGFCMAPLLWRPHHCPEAPTPPGKLPRCFPGIILVAGLGQQDLSCTCLLGLADGSLAEQRSSYLRASEGLWALLPCRCHGAALCQSWYCFSRWPSSCPSHTSPTLVSGRAPLLSLSGECQGDCCRGH